jgi:hypothetical protein
MPSGKSFHLIVKQAFTRFRTYDKYTLHLTIRQGEYEMRFCVRERSWSILCSTLYSYLHDDISEVRSISMSTHIVIAYPEKHRAAKVLATLKQLRSEDLIDLAEAFYVAKDQEGTPRSITQCTIPGNVLGGARWQDC